MKNYRVIKIGGSNLRSPDDIARILNLLKSYNDPLVVVFSAFFGVTDQLVKVFTHTDNIYRYGKQLIADLRKMKIQIIEQFIQDTKLQQQAVQKLDKRLNQLDKSLLAAHCLGKTPPFLKDEIISFGERLSTLVITQIVNSIGFNYRELLPEDIPLLTDGVFENASLDCQVNESALKKLKDGNSYIIPGFYGVSSGGKKTLLGRGGSDYSAACIANCINAVSLDVWKDVDGFMDADPAIINQASTIKELSYDEASELASFGASILHPSTVDPLRVKNIPVRIFNMKNSKYWDYPKSVITNVFKGSKKTIKGISVKHAVRILSLKGAAIVTNKSVLSRLANVIDRQNIPVWSVSSSPVSMNILLHGKHFDYVKNEFKNASVKGLEKIEESSEISAIAIVGENLIDKPGVLEKIFSILQNWGVNTKVTFFGASKAAVYFIVNKPNALIAVKALHESLFFNKNQYVLES
jgi:aspartate kinase/aspartokinase/homoserine dehydrogenase 1